MNWDRMAEDYLTVAHQVFSELAPLVETVALDMADRIRKGHKVLICGNGGSAADAQHFSAELINRFLLERRPYACVALTTDTSTLTAIANDYGYEYVFEKQVQALGQPGDMLFAISTSGNAVNVCKAVEAAQAGGLHTVALTGGAGGKLAKLADVVLSVSCTAHTPRIQEGHGLLIHALCERVEEVIR